MYVPVVGLEIHVQAKTNSKMFCRCDANYFEKPANSNICPVCFGLPGALPVPNKTAFEKTIKLALALNCEINKNTKFDRKNYFYPDLPKGYQISQYDKPIGVEGYVEIEIEGDSKRIAIQRIHLEEDTAKSLHSDNGETLIDYNKSGVALMEIVTKPEFESVSEVLAFAKRLRQIVRYLDVSDAEMQKGQMRFELNISVKDDAQAGLPDYKVEVKNIGSISVLEKVLKSEFERQKIALENGEEIKSQTRGLKDMSGETVFQRAKETADDYRYFPEPDIPPIQISDSQISEIRNLIVELPHERYQRYLNLGLNPEQADIFVEDRARGDMFDRTIKEISNYELLITNYEKEVAKFINTDIAGFVIKKNIDFSDSPVQSSDLAYLIQMIAENKITGKVAKQVIEEIFEKGGNAKDIVESQNLIIVADDSAIDAIVEQVITQNQKVVLDIQKNPNAIKFLVGQVMKLSKGTINPVQAEERLKEKLQI